MWLVNYVCLYICVSIVQLVTARPSLSDPLGLENIPKYKFGLSSQDYVNGSIWPKPQSEVREDVFFTLDPAKFKFVNKGKVSDVLDLGYVRYMPLVFPDKVSLPVKNLDEITVLEVTVQEDYKPLELDTDESYVLDINYPTSTLKANTCWGALRGLETFSQAVYQDTDGKYFAQRNTISDFPRFKHRGFLIDTSRHYVSVVVIKQFLDAMSYSKFNVLHWHIVDDQSFPYVSVTYPSLHGQGARNNKTHIYKKTDIQDIIDYARLRGIRVVPEFDTPGHTQSWHSIPNLLTKCYSGGKPNGNFGPIDPTHDDNYHFLQNFFREIADVFPDKYLHMGGDEVSFSCWQSNPNITAWMKEKGISGNYSLLEQYYEQKLLDIIKDLKKQYVIWQEVVDNGVTVQDNTVVNIWKGNEDQWKQELLDVTQKGYKVILSSPWYLNYIAYGLDWHPVAKDTVVNIWLGNWLGDLKRITGKGYRAILSSPWYLNYISYGPDWPKYYEADPQGFSGSKEQLDLVIGGTACMWGEWVDGTNLISRTWGRGLSVGERLWSSKETRDLTDATRRIWEHRCRYLRRGINAENVVQSEYCRHEWKNTH